jgi:hypothetical protein
MALATAVHANAGGDKDWLLVEIRKKCGVRIHWKIEGQLVCNSEASKTDATAYCVELIFKNGENQCIITTKPRLTHETLGEAVRSCLVKLPKICY